jgi:predicted nuclease of predicted toxin-antitoxin system
VYQATVQLLSGLGHDVATVASIGMAKAPDVDLLAMAQRLDRIFVTRDRDFGGLAFVRQLGAGVIYLRMLPSTINVVHQELERVLNH